MSLTRQVTPADDYEVKLNVVVTAIVGEVIFTFTGKDEYGNVVSEALTLNATGTYTTTKRFKSVNTLGVVRSGFDAGESITCAIIQDRWGRIWKVRSGLDLQYQSDAHLQIGDGSTLSGLWILLQTLIMGTAKKITVTNNAYFYMGELLDETLKKVDMGGSLTVTTYPNGLIGNVGSTIAIYGSYIKGGDRSLQLSGSQNRFWHVLFDGIQISGENYDVYNVTFVASANPFNASQSTLTGTFDKILVVGGYVLVPRSRFMTGPVTLSNVYSRGHTYVTWDGGIGSLQVQDATFINCDFDTWVHLQIDDLPKIWRKYEFDVHCQDKDGNLLSGVSAIGEYISPYGEAFSVTTDANGDIVMQTVAHGWWEKATGNTEADENLKTPLKVTYSKAGYKTVVKYYPLNEKTKDRVVLQKTIDIIFVDGKPALNLSETDPENELYAQV